MKNSAVSNDFLPLLTLSLPRLDEKEARARLCAALKSGGSCTKVYTPTPQLALHAYDSPAFSRILRRGDLLLADGIGLVLASRLLGSPLPARIAGIDAGRFVLKVAQKRALSVALLGARPGVAERAAEKLRRELPKLRICYVYHGYFERNGEENEAVLADLRAAKPDILFVCFGSPAQEAWIDRHAASVPSLRLCMGLGGSLDVWAGEIRRAPRAVSACGLEWLWRTLREPRRARIFLDIPRFFLLVLRQKKQTKKAAVDQT